MSRLIGHTLMSLCQAADSLPRSGGQTQKLSTSFEGLGEAEGIMRARFTCFFLPISSLLELLKLLFASRRMGPVSTGFHELPWH